MTATKRRHDDAFTLIELLVVISIVTLLISILLPALRHARKSAQALNSLSNMRQWAIGTQMYMMESNEFLPWEGRKPSELSHLQSFTAKEWWGNVVPPYVGQKKYLDLYIERHSAGLPIPLPPDSNIFIDPSAQLGPDTNPTGNPAHLRFYSSYVVNANLTNSAPRSYKPYASGPFADMELIRFSQVRFPAATVQMFEIAATTMERRGKWGYAGGSLVRMKGDFKYLAARHFDGGHIAFGDGHAKHVTYDYANTDKDGNFQTNELLVEKHDLRWRMNHPLP